jgi:hypothetical protein
MYAELEQACFGMAYEPSGFPELKKKWEQLVANTPSRFFSSINPTSMRQVT